MSTRTSTRTSTVLSSQRTQQKSQENPKPFNKRPARSDHSQAVPVKVRKLSRSDSATRRAYVEIPAKTLASALKRREESISLRKDPPAAVVPAKRSPGKVRFFQQGSTQGSRRPPKEQPQGNIQTSGDTVQVVVQLPSLVDGRGGRRSNSPQRKTENVAEDDETAIVTTQIEPSQRLSPNPDADFQTRYREIKSLAWIWVKNYFSDITPEAKKSLNLLHLAHTSPQLMECANWISCCGQKRTWEGVFNEQRAQLVYGVLGKMLEVHVFGHEMFGANKEQLRELRELDMELIDSDGFYRQRCRAHKILAFLPDPNTPTPNFHHSLTALHASFIELLSPLLPQSPPGLLQPQLLTILLKAATLSLSTRRERNVVYHWETHPAVGSFFESETMHILNATEHREEDDWRRNTDLEVVTMAGWPSCVAYRPNAADGPGPKKKKGPKPKLGVNRIGRAEVCVTFGPAVKPLSVQPDNWLGKRLRVEMTERDAAKRAADAKAAVAKKVAVLGVGVSAVLGLEYLVGHPSTLDEVLGYLGSFV
ncbi:hypothetical protein HO173_006862 [Letharia columbiana]|uniref:Uncharacterized protein n=1 Tax=Letharia columbiana TaxID=112416 RepID=A0A8H6FUD2_9LECA|nr:uncharacterized protein HO173_006862 [Letharia columbiana]KAF6234932.1 hypothetical protein HO173_006862 [Letharia columbiana]